MFIFVSVFVFVLARGLLRQVLLFGRCGIEFLHRRPGIVAQPVARIALKKIIESRPRLYRIIKIVLIDLGDRKERVEAVPAARIFLAQKAILLNGAAQNFVIVKAPPHLDHEFGRRHDARVRLRRRGRAKVDGAIGIENPLIFAAGALRLRTAVQSLPHALRFGELLTSPRIVVVDASRRGNQRRQHQQQHDAKAKGAAASS